MVKTSFSAIGFCGAMLFGFAVHAADTWFVKAANFGKEGLDGRTEETAWGTLQDAHDNAAAGDTVKVLEGSSLPLGILEALRPDASAYTLLENDVLLFLTDGVVDAFGSASDLYDCLRSIPIGNPQQLTDTLVQSALRLQNGVAKDDMTALAVRLFRKNADCA